MAFEYHSSGFFSSQFKLFLQSWIFLKTLWNENLELQGKTIKIVKIWEEKSEF